MKIISIIKILFVISTLSLSASIDVNLDIAMPSILTPDVSLPGTNKAVKDAPLKLDTLDDLANKAFEEVPGFLVKGNNKDITPREETLQMVKKEMSFYDDKPGFLGSTNRVIYDGADMPRFSESEINFFGQHPNNHYENPQKDGVSQCFYYYKLYIFFR